jgi:hypothetical protein
MAVYHRYYWSDTYLWSAEERARLADDIEKLPPDVELDRRGRRSPTVEHSAYVVGAVTDSVAFMECVINEVLQDVTDEFESHIGTLSRAVRQRLVGYWITGERSSILDKYDHVLKLAGRAPMNRGVDPAQSAVVLVALRNYFVHYKPETIGRGGLIYPRLEKRLQGRFVENRHMAGTTNPWFPDRAVGAGCAKWAHETARAFVDHWASLMKLTNLPYQGSGLKKAPS